MTAVEWLQSQIVFESVDKELLARWDEDSDLSEYFEQAKEMEKKQSNAKIQKAIEVFEEAKSKAITIQDMFYYLDIVLVALEGIKNETFKSE